MTNALDYFELQYDEQMVLQGEALFDAQQVHDLKEVEKRLWTARVDGHEVEVSKPQNKRREVTCTCASFQTQKICPHIIATLFAIRSEMRHQAKSSKRASPIKSKTLTINTVFDQVTSDQLHTFIRAYAKKNKKFGTVLKAHFASKIDLEDNVVKYQSLLDSIIKPVRTTETYANATQVKHFLNVCVELLDQLDDCTVLGAYTEAFAIWSTLTAKVAYVSHYAHVHQPDLQKMEFRLWSALKTILQQDLSPDLRSQFEASAIEVAQLSYYEYQHVLYQPLEVLLASGVEPQRLVSAADEVLKLVEEHDQRLIVLAFSIRLQELMGQPVAVDEVIHRSNQDLPQLLRTMLKANDYQAARQLSERILAQYPDSPSVSIALVEIYEHLSEGQELQRLTFDAFMRTHEMRYLKLLKRHTPTKQWPALKRKLIDGIDKVKVKTEILRFDTDWPALAALLADHLDLDLLQTYDSLLNVHVPDQLAKLYLTYFKDYLAAHFGNKASEHLQEIFYHLERIGALSTIKKLHRFLTKEHPKRLTGMTL